MSIRVTHNLDGTTTVECGNDIIIIPKRSAVPSDPPEPWEASPSSGRLIVSTLPSFDLPIPRAPEAPRGGGGHIAFRFRDDQEFYPTLLYSAADGPAFRDRLRALASAGEHGLRVGLAPEETIDVGELRQMIQSAYDESESISVDMGWAAPGKKTSA